MAHHDCKGINEEFTQCVIFDGNTKDAHLIGVEYLLIQVDVRGPARGREEALAPA
ncbi:DUF1264 domain-containing protein [Sorangium sp. So ce590]|uniref:DUF1264 domain-containing protein n=1 Tax=unclassified Sorangium TaxID=2621164 RepID=UPI003F6344B6